MKKKIGILNFHFSNNNYGAVLQAYALQCFLKSNNFKCENIDLQPKIHWKTKFIYLVLGNPFEKFRKLNLRVSKFKYINRIEKESLYLNEFSSIIVGSDQVWRPSYCEFPENYFLDFALKGQKKIAYAASFGVDKWDDEINILKYKKYLKQFDFISVREDSGIDICEKIFNVKAKQVLDPTLLISKDYFKAFIKSNNINNGCLVYYKLDTDMEFNNSIDFVAQELNLSISNIYYKHGKILNKKFKKYLKVEDWLGSIANANIIVTDSYHCVCFAIIFEKNFIYYVNNKNRGLTRILSLLNVLGLSDRIVYSIDDIKNKMDIIKSSVNYFKVNEIIKNLKLESTNFLLNALKEG